MSIHTSYTRKRIDLKLPIDLLKTMDKHCIEINKTRTAYIESLIEQDLKNKELIFVSEKAIDTWNNAEDIPFKPKTIRKVIYAK